MLEIKKIRNELIKKEDEARKVRTTIYLGSNVITTLFAFMVWIYVKEKSDLIIPFIVLIFLFFLGFVLLRKRNNKRKAKEINYVSGEVKLKPNQVIVTCDCFSFLSTKDSKWKVFNEVKPKTITVINPQSPTAIKTYNELFIFNNSEELRVLLAKNRISFQNYFGSFPNS